MSEFSFDIVSKVDGQSLADAVHQAQREIATRFDFKNSKSSIELADFTITIIADDDMKLKRGVSLKALKYGNVEPASGGTLRQIVTCAQGIDKDHAKKVIEGIKGAKLKVTTQIQDNQIRVASKSKDDLQKANSLVNSMPLDLPVQILN